MHIHMHPLTYTHAHSLTHFLTPHILTCTYIHKEYTKNIYIYTYMYAHKYTNIQNTHECTYKLLHTLTHTSTKSWNSKPASHWAADSKLTDV